MHQKNRAYERTDGLFLGSDAPLLSPSVGLPYRSTLTLRFVLVAMVVIVVFSTAVTGWTHGRSERGQSHLDPSRLTELIQALTETSHKVRLQAALLLGESRDAQAVSRLAHVLRSDPYYTVRAAAAAALARGGAPRAVAPLIAAAAIDDEAFVRREAREALSTFSRNDAVPYAIASYASESAAVRRQVVTYLLADLPSAGDGVVIRALGDVDSVSAVARRRLRKLPPHRALELLARAVDHREPTVRQGALSVLGDLGSREAAAIVLDVFGRDAEVDSVRAACRSALRILSPVLPMNQLIGQASSSNPAERAAALKILAVVGGDRARETAELALGDSDLYVRGAAVMALRDLKDIGSVAKLTEVAEDPQNLRIVHLVHHAINELRNNRSEQ